MSNNGEKIGEPITRFLATREPSTDPAIIKATKIRALVERHDELQQEANLVYARIQKLTHRHHALGAELSRICREVKELEDE